MENEIISFTNKEFGEIRSILIDNEPWFVGKDICNLFGDKNHNRSLSRISDEDKDKFEILTKGGKQTLIFINESGLYSLLFSMQPQKINKKGIQDAYPLETEERIKKLKHFKRWVTHDVLPSIRKTGSYSVNQKLESYMIDDPIERAKRWIEEEQERQALKLENTKLTNEVIYKEDVIINLVDSISTADKRQVLNRVVRKGGKNYSERWNALYKEFEAKYHCDVKRRMDNYNENHKAKLRNKLDYIDKVMNKIPELYEIACKLYENDVKELVSEMYYLNDLDTDLQKVIN